MLHENKITGNQVYIQFQFFNIYLAPTNDKVSEVLYNVDYSTDPLKFESGTKIGSTSRIGKKRAFH